MYIQLCTDIPCNTEFLFTTNTVVDNETSVMTSVHVQITSVPFILLFVGVTISLDTSGRLLGGEILEKLKEKELTIKVAISDQADCSLVVQEE